MKKIIFWITAVLVFFIVVLIIIPKWWGSSRSEYKDYRLIKNYTVEKGVIKTTSKVNYKFRLLAKNHAFYAKYTGMDEWTYYPPDGIFEMPRGAKAGPIELRTDETEPFEIYLMRKKK
ncbi:MAG: hypothetical protein M3P22_01455 [bacterium]|nr:hypothetical protein [bacterium]